METDHIVRDLSFDISFASETEALAQHNNLGSFVSGRLMAAVHEVFNGVSPSGGNVFRIDTLDIDLGPIAASSYYEEAERRLRDKLEEALRLRMPASGPGFGTAPGIGPGFGDDGANARERADGGSDSPGIVSRAQSELDVVVCFLETGHMPWNFSVSTGRTVEKMLRRAIAEAGPGLVGHLKSAHDRENLARRLAWQFPEDLLTGLARLLEPAAAESMARVRAHFESFLVSGGETPQRAGRRYWEFTLLRLIGNRGTPFNLSAWIEGLARTFAERESTGDSAFKNSVTASLADDTPQWGTDTGEVWREMLEKAVASGDPRNIRPFWSTLLGERPELIAQVVGILGLRADVRRSMALGFPEPMLRDIAGILEPSEIGFIEELVGRPDLFRQAAQQQAPGEESGSAPVSLRKQRTDGLRHAAGADVDESFAAARRGPSAESEPVLKSRLWEFTFTYLLVERGSRFNKRTYVASIVRQMAAHDNLGFQDLLASLAQALDRVEARSFLKEEMLSLLEELREDEELPEASTEDGDTWEELLGKALTSGDAGPIGRFWPDLVNHHPQIVERIVRRYGVDARVRHAMAQGFPEPMLCDIAATLEPSEAGFIEEMVRQPEPFREAVESADEGRGSVPVLKARLWEFTLTYLLAERGSRFNRRSYVASVVRQMASHHNVKYEDLVASLTAVVDRIKVSSPLNREMQSLLADLSPERRAHTAPAAQSAFLPQDLLEKALVSGNAAPILPFWQDWMRNDRQLLARIFRRLGVRADVRGSIANGFPESILRDFTELLEPGAARFIQDLLGLEPVRESRRRLWECTFAVLLVEQPGRFARRHYVESLVRRLALDTPGGRVPRPAADASVGLRGEPETSLSPSKIRSEDGTQVPPAALESSLASVPDGIKLSEALKRELNSLLAHFGANSCPDALFPESARAATGGGEGLGDICPSGVARPGRALLPESARAARPAVPKMSATTPGLDVRPGRALLPESPSATQAEFSPHDLLEKAFVGGSADLILPHWQGWMRSDRQLLARVLRRLGVRADVRRSIANGFPESVLRDIARVLEPGVADFMEGFLQRASVPDSRRQLWDFTLTFLLAEQYGRFKTRSYVASMVRQMAARDNLRSLDLVASMSAVLERLTAPNPAEKNLLRLLRELADEFRSPAESRIPGPSDVIRSCELYDAVSARIVRGEAPPAGGLVAGIDELLRKYPWQLLRMLREFRTEVRAGSASAYLSDTELRCLVEALVLLRGAKPETLQAFELHAGRTGRKRLYYRLVLDLLIEDRSLDFEALEAGGNGEADPGEMASPPALLLPDQMRDAMPDALIGSALDRAETLSAPELSRLVRALDRLLIHPPEWFLQLLNKRTDGFGRARILAGVLPGRQLARLLHLTAPPGWHQILLLADTIVDACGAGGFISGSVRMQRIKWQFLFQYLIQDKLPVSDASFIRHFIACLAEQNGYRDDAALSTLVARQLHRGSAPSTAAMRRRILDILQATGGNRVPPAKPVRKPPSAPPSQPKAPQPKASPIAYQPKKSVPDAHGQDIFIRNAGQVLATPYLPRLFQTVGLLEGNVFPDQANAERGVHLLQYMVDESIHPTEDLLTLNKILCGLQPETAVRRDIDLTDTEKQTVDGLLRAMIAHWKTIGNTSVQGLRESFLQREGRLRPKEDAWQLLVQPRAFDMLLDRLPWGFAVIRHPWMTSTVYVEWR